MRKLATTAAAIALLATGWVAAQAQSDTQRGHAPAASENAQSNEQSTDRSRAQRSPQGHSTSRTATDRDAARPSGREQSEAARQSREPTTGQTAATDRDRRILRDQARDRRQPDRRNATRDRDRGNAANARDRGNTASDRNRGDGASRTTDQRNQASSAKPRQTTGQSSESSTRTGPDQRNSNANSQGRDRLSLSRDDRTRVSARFSTAIDRLNVRPIPRSRISVSIGAVVPRSIHLHTVPADIVSIYPRFRGMRFVVVEDDIVIVSPRSNRVVAVLPRSEGSHYASREGTSQRTRETTGVATRDERLVLSPRSREIIHTTVLSEPACHYEQKLDFFLFMPVPRTVQVCQFPSRLVEEVPEIRSYRYVVHGNDVAIVDPDQDRVVELID